jgi:hypothetical protein
MSEFKVEITNTGWDKSCKLVSVTDGNTTLTKHYLYQTPWTNFLIRRWVKSAKKTLKSIRGE